jgi:hypothetical protein
MGAAYAREAERLVQGYSAKTVRPPPPRPPPLLPRPGFCSDPVFYVSRGDAHAPHAPLPKEAACSWLTEHTHAPAGQGGRGLTDPGALPTAPPIPPLTSPPPLPAGQGGRRLPDPGVLPAGGRLTQPGPGVAPVARADGHDRGLHVGGWPDLGGRGGGGGLFSNIEELVWVAGPAWGGGGGGADGHDRRCGVGGCETGRLSTCSPRSCSSGPLISPSLS